MAIALIVAAGRGERLGSDGPKAFIGLAGRPMLEWSIAAFRAVAEVRTIVVAVPPGWQPSGSEELSALAGCVVCDGGAERSHSVRNALAAAGEAAADEAVLVHDAARPLVSPDLIERLITAVSIEGGAEAAIAAAAVVDTIKIADSEGYVASTPDRARLRAVQTPQAFRHGVLAAALGQGEEALAAATDDAALVEAMGIPVAIVEAPADNFKVTAPKDLKLAELLLSEREAIA